MCPIADFVAFFNIVSTLVNRLGFLMFKIVLIILWVLNHGLNV